LTNELPSFNEGSGALVGRFIVILFPQSFFGREDTKLLGKLVDELPGILNWAIEGYRRMNARGHFGQPTKAQAEMQAIEMLGSPVKGFVRDHCEVGAGYSIDQEEMFTSWKAWCEVEGRRNPGTKEWFTRNLHSAVPGTKTGRPYVGGVQIRVHEG